MPAAFRSEYTITQQRVQLSAAAPVRVQPITCGVTPVRPHDHDYYEICVVRGGSTTHQTALGKSRLSAGSVVIVPPGDVHAFWQLRRLDVTNVYYLTEWLLLELNSLWDQGGLVSMFLARDLFRQATATSSVIEMSLPRQELAELLRELDDVQRESASPQPSLVYLKSGLMKCLVLLSRAHARHVIGSTTASSTFRPIVRNVLDDVERCILACQPFEVSTIARRSGLSPDHLSRVFLAQTGWRPMEYFQRRRAQHATVRVLNRERSITDIAYELGYADAAHLSRAFRRYHGTSPRGYRKAFEQK